MAVRSDGRVEYRFRRPDPTGRTSWVTDGPALCRRLATLIPPPRSHTVRYHGVFSSAHRLRDRVGGDPLVVLAFLTDPEVTGRILDHLGPSAALPPIATARAPPADDELDLGCSD